MPVVLIVDDDSALRGALATALADMGWEAATAPDGETGLAWLSRRQADAVLLDLRMPGLDGIEVLRRIRQRQRPPPVAVLTAVPTAANTIEAMRLGAVDHLAKPIGREALRALMARMLPVAGGAGATAGETAAVSAPVDAGEVIGASAAMRAVQKAIGLLADSDATVLLLGETGTGKEVAARAIHRHGNRASRAFVAVNCAAIPAELLESLLFGHVRGAFTGAVSDRAGSFREADGGTLFLDEIGDMAMPMQAKLLRALQERVVTPVGGRPMRVDVRVIAATHRDLLQAVRDGRFREDLYYRLGVVPLRLPPLRERRADILPLAERFLHEAAGEPRRLTAAAAARLVSHSWPGNVRELLNATKRVATLVRRAVIDAGDLDFLDEAGMAATDWLAGTLPEAVARLEQAMIRRTLAETGGNRAQAAERLGIRRQLLYQKLSRYGLEVSANGTEPVPDADGTEPETPGIA